VVTEEEQCKFSNDRLSQLQNQSASISETKLIPVLFWCLSITLLAGTAVLTIMSLDWGMANDPPYIHYIAWLMSKGAVPYRDIFDMNFPGTFLLHLSIIKVLGTGDFAWRLFDLFWLGIINIFIIAYCRGFGALSTLMAVSMFSGFHLVGGQFVCGQRDYILVLFIIAGIQFFASSLEKELSLYRLFLSGLLFGAGMMIKPHLGFFYIILLLVVGIYVYKSGRQWLYPVLIFFISGCVIPGIIFIWLAANGALIHFLDNVFNYLIPFYSKIRLQPIDRPSLFGVPLVYEGAAVGIISLFYFIIIKHSDIRQKLLILGVGYGIIHFYIQSMGWYYYLYPLMFFSFLLAASWLNYGKLKYRRGIYTVILFFLFHLSIGLNIECIKNIITPKKYLHYTGEVHLLTDDLKGLLAPSEKIQVLFSDVTIHKVLLRLEYPIATRFLFDFHFFYSIDQPYIQKLRTEFLNALKLQPPKLFVVLKYGWPIFGYIRLKSFPELYAWINENYKIMLQRPNYRIYKLKS